VKEPKGENGIYLPRRNRVIRKPKISIWLLALAISAVAAVAVACGGDDESVDTPVPAATAKPAGAAATAKPGAAAATAKPAVAAATAKPAATTAPQTKTKILVVGLVKVDPPIFLPSESAFSSAVFNAHSGVFDSLLRYEHADPPDLGARSGEGIATAWKLNSAGDQLTFEIRSGVMFHDGSELTAEDVAYSMNDAIREGSKFGRAGELTRYMDNWEAINDSTVVVHLKEVIDPNWWNAQANTNGNYVPMISKAVSEKLGRDAAVTSMVATGPFKVVDWAGGEQLVAEAVESHWRTTPKIDQVRYVELPEESTRRAAYATGEIDIMRPSLKFIKTTQDSVPGSTIVQLDRGTGQSIIFSGNYWAEMWIEENETIFPRDGFHPDADHPWIGDPNDSEQAAKALNVRLALTMAIDRELVNDVAIGGLGAPAYTNSGFLPGDPGWKDEWRVDYDPQKAQDILKDAGYPNCFTVELQIASDLPALITPEVGQVIAQMWEQIGCSVKIQQLAYAANRPGLVARSMDIPWLMQSESYGFLYESKFHSMIPSAGFNYGIELPNDVAQPWYDNRTTVEESARIANNAKVEDFVSTNRLIAPVVQRILFWVVGPEVTSWKPRFGGQFNSPETVEMK
jgi:peptide/nickel transport system substrate-binding protein